MSKKIKSTEQKLCEMYTKTEIMRIVGCTFATASKWHDDKEFPLYALEKLGVKINKTITKKIELKK